MTKNPEYLADEGGTAPTPTRTPRRLRLPDVGLDRFSGLYVIVLMVVVFSLLDPENFASVNNARIILSSQAITGIITLAAMIGLIAGVFDLSIAATMTLAISMVGQLQASAGI